MVKRANKFGETMDWALNFITVNWLLNQIGNFTSLKMENGCDGRFNVSYDPDMQNIGIFLSHLLETENVRVIWWFRF